MLSSYVKIWRDSRYDFLVSVDDLIEDYFTDEPSFEYIQSCDIVAFNKIDIVAFNKI